MADLNLPSGIDANAKTTLGKDNTEVTVTLKPQYVRKATQLSIARTIIHELIHTYVKYKVNIYSDQAYSQLISDYYAKLVAGGKVDPNSTLEHEFMAIWVNVIAESLASYDFHRQPIEYYRSMSWAGLESSTGFNNLTLQQQTTAKDIIKNEATGNNKARGDRCPN